MSGSSKVMLVVTVLQGVNCVSYLWTTAQAPSGVRIGIMAFTLVAFFWCLYVLVRGVKLGRRLKIQSSPID